MARVGGTVGVEGGSAIGGSRVVFSDLEQDFVVAVYEQRGTGKSYSAFDPSSTHTLQQAVDDTTEVVDYLRGRFDEQKVYLLGESFGGILAVAVAAARPDLVNRVVLVNPATSYERSAWPVLGPLLPMVPQVAALFQSL